MLKKKFLSLAPRAATIDELVTTFDKFLKKPEFEFGVNKIKGVSINTTRNKANAAALKVLEEIDNPLLATEEQKEILRGYTGLGGVGASTSEYYTPEWLASGVWDMLDAYGGAQGNVLEPSAGTGVFMSQKPKGVVMTGSELSPTSARINEILHPEDTIQNTAFEAIAADASTDGHFDSVIGNVPFGNARTETTTDNAYPEVTDLGAYFVLRAIDKVKAGGYVTLVVPESIVSNKKWNSLRELISRKAEFLGAHKLPSGTFGKQGSDSVVTDIIVLRKHSHEFAEMLIAKDFEKSTLQKALVLWDTFITGKWFTSAQGEKFINGNVVVGGANWGGDSYEIPNLPKAGKGQRLSDEQHEEKDRKITEFNQATSKKLATKFESRIDYALLNTTEPVIIKYSDGDRRKINGRWHEMLEGDWVLVPVTDSAGLLDTQQFGVSSIDGIKNITKSAESALNVSFEQLKAINDTFGEHTNGIISQAFELTKGLPSNTHERVVKGVLIGSMIQDYSLLKEVDPSAADTLRLTTNKHLTNMYDKLGTSHKVKGIKNLRDQAGSTQYKTFVNAMDKNGNLSDLMNGDRVVEKTIVFDMKNPEHVIESLSIANGRKAISLDDFRDKFEGDLPESVDATSDSELLDYFAQMDEVAVDGFQGTISEFSAATSGNIVVKRNNLLKVLSSDTASALQKLNAHRQLEHIKKNQAHTSLKTVEIGFNDKWLPRTVLLEFFHDQGYDDLEYVKYNVTENGGVNEIKDYQGEDGVFTGYYTHNNEKVKSIKKENRTMNQIEKYLNGQQIRSGKSKETSKYRDQMRAMERQFQRWMMEHEDYAEFERLYNDKFNDTIAFQHSEESLNLQDVSGNIENMSHQNSAIRRMSEQGKGVLNYDTGTGKTFTGLGLIAYNTENGRSTRSAVVVPKSVAENWVYETFDFFGAEKLKDMIFINHELALNDDGTLQLVDVLDKDGKQTFYPKTGNVKQRPVITEITDAARKAEKLHQVVHSNTPLVLMTKETFASIPLMPQTIQENANEALDLMRGSEKIVATATNYKEQAKIEKATAKLLNDGTDKGNDLPYFEQLNFSTVVVDEAHNYRNSKAAGRDAGKLAYISMGTEAKVAVDMRQKMQYLGREQEGRGAVLLTATPTPNSILDIYNMLSHIMTPEEWADMGIIDQDDFVRMFGETEETPVRKLDGTEVWKEALVGFKNLEALRAIFNKYTTSKKASELTNAAAIPDVIEQLEKVTMSKEQEDVYELLRLRATVASAAKKDGGIADLIANSPDHQKELIEEIAVTYPNDMTFTIMRDMERAAFDLDLYNKVVTCMFDSDKREAVEALLADMPESKEIEVKDYDDNGEEVKVTVDLDFEVNWLENSQGDVKFSIHEAFEIDFIELLTKHGLAQSDIRHVISPKIAAIVDKVREIHENGGKQIIFSEEKNQHTKLHRIICQQLNLKPEQVGIINGDTVSGVSSSINDEHYVRETDKARKKRAKLEGVSVDELEGFAGGIEDIAKRFNDGVHRVLICNKKAEIGINLHKGTNAILNATLCWQPASQHQRNGRAARIGAPQKEVHSHSFLVEGSFDQHRYDTIQRKKSWQSDLLNGTDQRAANADAESDSDTALMLVANPEERAALEAKLKQDAIERRKADLLEVANLDLRGYIALGHSAATDTDALEEELATTKQRAASSKMAVDNAIANIERFKKGEMQYANIAYLKRDLANARERLTEYETKARKQKAKLTQSLRDKKKSKQLRSTIEGYMSDGVLENDSEILNNPNDCLLLNGHIFKVGGVIQGTEDLGYQKAGDTTDVRVITTINTETKKVASTSIVNIYETKDHSYNVMGRFKPAAISLNASQMLTSIKSARSFNAKYPSGMNTAVFLELCDAGFMDEQLVINADFEPMYVIDIIKSGGQIVVPDNGSEIQKEKMAQFYLAKLQQGQSPTNDNKITSMTTYFFGDNYKAEIVKYDPDAETDEDIAKIAAEYEAKVIKPSMAKLWEEIKDEPNLYGFEIGRKYRSIRKEVHEESGMNSHESSLRASDITDAIDDRTDEHLSDISKRYTEKMNADKEAKKQSTITDFESALTDSASVIQKRLAKIGTPEKIMGLLFDMSMRSQYLSNVAEYYYDNKVGLLAADLLAAGVGSLTRKSIVKMENVKANLNNENSLDLIFSSVLALEINNDDVPEDSNKANAQRIKSFLASEEAEKAPYPPVSPQVEPEPTPEPEQPQQVAVGDIKSEPSFASQLLKEANIAVSYNSKELTLKGRGARITRAAPYTVMVFRDNDGKAGKLYPAFTGRKGIAIYRPKHDDYPSPHWYVETSKMTEADIIEIFGLE